MSNQVNVKLSSHQPLPDARNLVENSQNSGTNNLMIPERLRISNIDWSTWQPEQVATLMFVLRDEEVLLIRKKRGLGAGKINGPGGRIENGETPLECAIRETEEELCITPAHIRPAGELFFHAEDMPRIHAFVYVARGFTGEPTETEEAIPLWTPINNIPFAEMWEDDRLWLDAVLSGQTIKGRFSFVEESLLDYCLEITPGQPETN